MTLHILNSLFNKNSQLEKCLNSVCNGDDIVFLLAGQLVEEKESIFELINKGILLGTHFHLINSSDLNRPDLDGPNIDHILEKINTATQKDFLSLSIKHEKSITWF